MKNQMHEIRNLLLSTPSKVKEYLEKEQDNIVVSFTTGTVITVVFHPSSGYFLRITTDCGWNRKKEVFKGFCSYEQTLAKILKYKNQSAEERWFELLRADGF